MNDSACELRMSQRHSLAVIVLWINIAGYLVPHPIAPSHHLTWENGELWLSKGRIETLIKELPHIII